MKAIIAIALHIIIQDHNQSLTINILVQDTFPYGYALPKYENARHFLGDDSTDRQYRPRQGAKRVRLSGTVLSIINFYLIFLIYPKIIYVQKLTFTLF